MLKISKFLNYVENCNTYLFFGEKCNLIYMFFLHKLFDEDEYKENVDPSSSKLVERSVYIKGASVKAFVDYEAEDDNEDILVRHDEDDSSEEDKNKYLKDLVETVEEKRLVDQWRWDELHRKWLEEQDSAETSDIFLRLGCGWRQKGARKPTLLSEEDDVPNEEDDVSNSMFMVF